ncbi:MAG: glycosyltransferase [Euryarchaeota archaeon]|nr:glycosyltransferase [Euryarchaeota archaeon]MBV1729110.1 glycosyltransferase [Methanobacterium sp.]MBU4548197.1 glycosyltransferase [Euryarchaeota archaeon]MBU4608293.1 glycosyltransferase [Euryarchaeota archaeon]MBV1754792.1 glycosyltransferase [Methanobacterium sp.]
MKKSKNISLGLLSFPSTKTGITPLSNMVEILLEVVGELHLVSGNESCHKFQEDDRLGLYCTHHHSSSFVLKRVWNYFYLQLSMALYVLRLRKVDFWIFFIGGDTLLLPMLMARLTGKKVILLFAGSSIQTLVHRQDKFAGMARRVSHLNCSLSSAIILYFKSLITEWGLEKYEDKILIQPRHFIDTENFKPENELSKREYLGYVGRLSREKGVMNLIKALPLMDKKVKFLICGEGPLKKEIEEYLQVNGLNNQVELTGWINHHDLPDYLNKMKLLVVPSYTEGFPNIILEALACGTPVAATTAGAIGEIIEDHENGFILKNNHPSTIAGFVEEFLDYGNLDKIVENGYHTVAGFDYNKIVVNWDDLLFRFYEKDV